MTTYYIPKTYYVKFSRSRYNDLIQGYAVPYQESEHKEVPNFASTKATADQWADEEMTLVLDNEPSTGFEMDINSVKDPRGFWQYVEPMSLNHVLSHCTVIEGVIQEPCVWVRGNDGNNHLVVVGSAWHKEVLETTERRLTRVSLRDLNRGDRVLLKDGSEAIYYGGFYARDEASVGAYNSRVDDDRMHWSVCWDKRRYLLAEERQGSLSFWCESSLHVSGRLEEADPVLTDEEALAQVNAASIYHYTNSYQFQHLPSFMLDKQAPEHISLQWDLVPREEWLTWAEGELPRGHYLVNAQCKWWLLYLPGDSWRGARKFTMLGVEPPTEGMWGLTYRTEVVTHYYTRDRLEYSHTWLRLEEDEIPNWEVYALTLKGRKGLTLPV